MLCRKRSVKSSRGLVPVHLNVYDLNTTINGYTYWLGLGAYHSGVQVHGVEYAFGGHEYPTTGIFQGEPKQYEGFTFRKSILIGWTDLTLGEVIEVMEKLSEKYRGDAYNLITRNCNHFCNDVCVKLTGNPIPNWINRLARIGLLCKCVIPVNLNSTKVGDHKIEEKVCKVEKKKLRSRSNRFSNNSSNSSSFSSSSSSPPIATSFVGRNRSLSALSSPLIIDSGQN